MNLHVITHHASRPLCRRLKPLQSRRAFTLIEILVVLAIIGILAGLVVNLMSRAGNVKVRGVAGTQLKEVEAVVEAYYAKRGFYPPSTTNAITTNALYYELVGTTNSGGVYTTLGGADSIASGVITSAFDVGGFANSAPADDPDARLDVKNFYQYLKPSQVRTLTVGNVPGARSFKVLVIPVKGPDGDFCIINYDAASPGRHNKDGFDLWVDVLIGGRSVRMGNWKD